MRTHSLFSLMITVAFMALLFQKAMAQNTSPYWSLAGNSNATASSKLGTTTAIPLRLTTNNSIRIYISPNAGNVGVGTTSPLQKLDVAGNINLAKDYGLYIENHRVLRVDSANNNIFLGNGIGANNTGFGNTVTGAFSLYANTGGYYNTATGAYALHLNTTGSGNVSNGWRALYYNTTGSSNTAIGNDALISNTAGNENVASGSQALAVNKTGSYNTAAGSASMYLNTTGNYNTALGKSALVNNTSGSENTAIGAYALDGMDGSWGNTAVGTKAGYYYKHGYNNTFIGSYATGGPHGIYNSIAIGNYAYAAASNQARIGNLYTTSIGGYANWTNISDGRIKRNIQENVPGLTFINKLRPVTYNLDLDAADKIMGIAAVKEGDGKSVATQLTQADIAARNAKQQVVYTGFVAQDVEKAAKELNYNFSGVDAAKNEKDLYGLRYTEFIMPLVKAVQELSKQADASKEEAKQLHEQLNRQQQQIDELRRMVLGQKPGITHSPTSAVSYLKQNIPNPASSSTRILYTLPSNTARAQLLLTDNSGKTVHTVSLTTSGAVDINTTALSNGVYNYSMVVDGNVIATKQLTVVR